MDQRIEKFLNKIGASEKVKKDFGNAFFSKLVNDSDNNKIIMTIKNKTYFQYLVYKELFDKTQEYKDEFLFDLSFEYENEELSSITSLINSFIQEEHSSIYKFNIMEEEKKIIIFYTSENLNKNEIINEAKNLYIFLKSINSSYQVLTQELIFDDDTTLIDARKEQDKKTEEYSRNDYYFEEEKGNYHEVKIKDIKNYTKVIVVGTIFKVEEKKTKKDTLMKTIKFADGESATYLVLFENKLFPKEEIDKYVPGLKIKVKGKVDNDMFNHSEVYIKPTNITILPENNIRVDEEKEKRVELHLHTKMSSLDGVTSVEDYAKRIKELGHKAFAVTDHAVVQAFPKFYSAAKSNNIKPIFGCEFYIVDRKRKFIYNPSERKLKESTYVVFDTETTGLSCKYNRLIEFGAIKMNSSGQKIDEIDFFIRPDQKLSKFSIEHSHISQLEADQGKPIKQALNDIMEFFADSILVAHNASFDFDFINEALINNNMEPIKNPVIDTLELSRYLNPTLKSHREGALARIYDIEFDESTAHRANYDAEHLSLIFLKMLNDLEKDNENLKHSDLENLEINEQAISSIFANHVTVYAKNQQGLKDLYELVSIASTKYISRDGNPLLLKEEIDKRRKDLLIGSACFNGEVFEHAMTKGNQALANIMKFYDFIEVQPPRNYIPLIYKGSLNDEEAIKNVLKDLIQIAKENNKLVCATGDVHYFSKEEKIFRDVLISAKGLKGVRHPLNFAPYESTKDKNVLLNWYNNPLPNPDQEFLTTKEMKDSFAFLNDKELIDEIVIKNTNFIADSIEDSSPVKSGLHTPVMPGSEEKLTSLVWQTAKERYGDPLPKEIKERLDIELHGITSNGYSVIFWLSSMIVNWTNQQGYIVGSRGSVGSSLVAMFSGITEVNPLPPHYICPSCHNLEWADVNKYESGFDLEEKECPKCHHKYDREGQNIPFATFLGFNAEKVPDIDLNFPSDYQEEAMQHLSEELNNTGNTCYRAGTIQAIQDKQALGYVRGYLESLGKSTSEISRTQQEYLASGCIDVRRSTGQHPGGIIVIPKGMSVFDFTPYQYPANKVDSSWKTTHFDFHSIHDNVLKFDALAHIDPCAVKYMNDLCHFEFKSLSKLKEQVDITDPKVVSVFISPDALNLKNNVLNEETGALGLPEFGTVIGRKTLKETKPKTFADLVRICGLSHGTDVYTGNARNLILDENKTLSDVIACRDDIMVTLSQKYGIDNSDAFNIMEIVRKGRFNLKDIGDKFYKYEQLLKEHHVPEYYIKSCEKIKYLFPKAHAVAYVSMACRCAWYKIYHPKEYYAAFFSLRLDAFDYKTMINGIDACLSKMRHIQNKEENHEDVSDKEIKLIDTYESTIEMYDRGIEFGSISLEKSDSTKFIIDEESGKIIPPFKVLDSLGEKIANNIVEERKIRPFSSIEDLQNRAHVNETLIKNLKSLNVLDDLDEDEQIRLF